MPRIISTGRSAVAIRNGNLRRSGTLLIGVSGVPGRRSRLVTMAWTGLTSKKGAW